MPFTAWWAHVVASYPAYQIEIVGTLAVQVACFWIPSLLYIWLDSLLPGYSARHKIQPPPKQPTKSEIVHCAVVVSRNQLLSLVLGLLNTAAAISLAGKTAGFRVDAELPSAAELAGSVAICSVLREVLFYYAHRLLHLPALYRRFHKTHHRFTAPVALAAQYAHPLDHILANALPIAIPLFLVDAHVLTAWSFLGIVLLETATVHSGYDFLDGMARMHDKHHERFEVNYGVLGWLDWLHGTREEDKNRMKRKSG
jgi:methylsterol monooxygenase